MTDQTAPAPMAPAARTSTPEAPTPEAPTAEAPTTLAPTTVAPTTVAPATQATDLLKVLGRLIEVLRQEIQMLKRMDPSGIQNLQQDKIVLTAAYDSLLSRFRESPDMLKSLAPELRDQIMALTTEFQTALTDNARALFAVKEANDRLFKAIVQAVEDKRTQSNTYSASGSLATAAVTSAAQPMSLAFDQRL